MLRNRNYPRRRQLRQSCPAKSPETPVYLCYDARMADHRAADEDLHDKTSTRPECPARIEIMYQRLQELEEDLTTMIPAVEDGDPEDATNGKRFIPIAARQATRDEIEQVHTAEHYEAMAATAEMSEEQLRSKTDAEETDKDLVWNAHTFLAALLSAGSAIECVDAVLRPSTLISADDHRHCTRSISISRPPGHHASAGKASGFCYFNNVALAARHALNTRLAKRIAIVDFDVHHGNGTQDIFYDEENVFFISLHRYENDHDYTFYPGTGKPDECGSSRAKGMNLNVAWTEEGVGDEDYAAAFAELILPTLSAFHPDLLLISCGFDAADGDLLGDCSLTPRGYYSMTRSLLKTIGHDVPVIAVLEGGYNLDVIPSCMETVALALLDEPLEPNQRDLIRADSLPREVLEELFGPIDDDENINDEDIGSEHNPWTDEQVERRQTMVRRGTAFGRQELLSLWRHPTRDGDVDFEDKGQHRNVKSSTIRDINTSMRYLRNCPFWKDMWSMNIVDLHDIDIPDDDD